MNEYVPANVVKLVKHLKVTGWWFVVGGTILCIDHGVSLANAQARTSVNGASMNFSVMQIIDLLLLLAFPLLGLFFLITPIRLLRSWLSAFDRFGKATVSKSLDLFR